MTAKSKKTFSSLGLELLSKVKSVEERSASIYNSVAKDCEAEFIEKLEKEILLDEENLFDLSEFNLETDRNRGRVTMTREECLNNFKKILFLEKELAMKKLDLELRKEIFKKYFEEKGV